MLMELKASPTSPSEESETKVEETFFAFSTAWPVTVVPPIWTVSVPLVNESENGSYREGSEAYTSPLAPEPSAY